MKNQIAVERFNSTVREIDLIKNLTCFKLERIKCYSSRVVSRFLNDTLTILIQNYLFKPIYPF